MKTRISQLAVAILFALFISIGNSNATEKEAKASSHENIEEAKLEMENWMTDENVWNTSSFNYSEAVEANLEVENWMTSSDNWEIEFQGLTIEDWMTDENIWEIELAIELTTEEEKDLAMEKWMVNENIWNI